MWTNPLYHQSQTVVSDVFLNRDAKNNVSSIFTIATTPDSALKPMTAGIFGSASTFSGSIVSNDVVTIPWSRIIKITEPHTKQWRILATYNAVTSPSCIHISIRERNVLTTGYSEYDSTYSAKGFATVFISPTNTSSGVKFASGSWMTVPSSASDAIYEIAITASPTNTAQVSDVSAYLELRFAK